MLLRERAPAVISPTAGVSFWGLSRGPLCKSAKPADGCGYRRLAIATFTHSGFGRKGGEVV
jgi:hypothetical protein